MKTIFIPPTWIRANGCSTAGAPRDFYAAWESQGGKVEYSRFRTYEISYAISIIPTIAIAAIYLILWKKEGRESLSRGEKTQIAERRISQVPLRCAQYAKILKIFSFRLTKYLNTGPRFIIIKERW